MVVQLSILVGNVADLIGLGYTRIEVHQSIDQGNSFQEITASTAEAAALDSLAAETTYAMGGRLLKLRVNGGAEQEISFSSVVSQWTASQVVNRINEVVSSLATVVDGAVRLTSSATGRVSSIEITYCDASDLGWVGGEVSYGKAARLTLVGGTYIYSFPDVAGARDDRYRWRFSANGVNPISDFSEVVQGQTAPLLSSGNLSVGTARFYGPDGRPSPMKVLIVVDSLPQSVAGVYLSKDTAIEVSSDEDGFMQVTLVRGAKVRMALLGTTYVREFIVPSAATFDLLTTAATATDPFTVQTVPPLLIRRNI